MVPSGRVPFRRLRSRVVAGWLLLRERRGQCEMPQDERDSLINERYQTERQAVLFVLSLVVISGLYAWGTGGGVRDVILGVADGISVGTVLVLIAWVVQWRGVPT